MKSFPMKLAVAIVVLLGGALFFGVGPANAATFDLTNTNIDLPGLSILIRVTTGADCAPAPFDICVAYISSNLLNNPLGIDQFGYAALGPVNGFPVLSSDPPGWASAGCPVVPGGCNMDGFGRFTNEADKPAANDLSFKLNLASLPAFAPNARGARFAAHIRFDQDCSLFVSDGTAAERGPPGGCRLRDAVPEPGAALLLGTGLAAILGGLRTRRCLIARA